MAARTIPLSRRSALALLFTALLLVAGCAPRPLHRPWPHRPLPPPAHLPPALR